MLEFILDVHYLLLCIFLPYICKPQPSLFFQQFLWLLKTKIISLIALFLAALTSGFKFKSSLLKQKLIIFWSNSMLQLQIIFFHNLYLFFLDRGWHTTTYYMFYFFSDLIIPICYQTVIICSYFVIYML